MTERHINLAELNPIALDALRIWNDWVADHLDDNEDEWGPLDDPDYILALDILCDARINLCENLMVIHLALNDELHDTTLIVSYWADEELPMPLKAERPETLTSNDRILRIETEVDTDYSVIFNARETKGD